MRDYRPGDLDALVALDGECFERGIAYSRREMARFLGLATREALVAEEDGRIAGFCIGHRAPRGVGRIITLDVRPGARQSGLGTVLLEGTIARLVRAGASRTVLEVDVRNAGAIAFYIRRRFLRAGILPDYYGPGRDAIEMTRSEREPPDVPR